MDESYIELKCYIKYNLYYGQSAEKIKQALLNAGWPEEIIASAFAETKKPAPFVPKPKTAVGKFIPFETPKDMRAAPKIPYPPKEKEGNTPEIPPPPQ